MPDWLTQPFHADVHFTLTILIVRLLVAFALGCVVAGIYRLTHTRPGPQGIGLMATLVLLTILLTMMTLVIGDNVARAFSLVGALAIVRFRTVVEDTRDTAFVIFAVAVGMAVGAGYLLIPVLTIPVTAVAAFIFRPHNGAAPLLDYTLTVRLGAAYTSDSLLRPLFDSHVRTAHLTAITTARQGAAFEKTYNIRLRQHDNAITLVTALHAIEGVQGVELHHRD